MPYATTPDGIRLYYEEAGQGTPVIFVHEFGGDLRSWEPQIRYFSRRYRCVRFAARGYHPSDIPETLDSYSQRLAVEDIKTILEAINAPKAHIIGLSMGGFAALHFGLTYPELALSLVVAGSGYGAEKEYEDYFRKVSLEVAKQFEEQGSEAFSKVYALAPSRIIFQEKDPLGWQEFATQLSEHSAIGSALTMRGVQAQRPSIYDLEPSLRQLSVPVLIMSGDEDDHCLQPAIFMKQTIPASGLAILPKSGHTLNLEEPALFNAHVSEFLALVEQGRWHKRDPRSMAKDVMKTS